MKTKLKTVVTVMFVVMIFTFACIDSMPNKVTKEATAAPEVVPTQQVPPKEGKLEITSTSSYIDDFNDYNVVGEIVNDTNETLENITLSVSITDASGNSLLKDENDNPVKSVDVQPYISVLAPSTTTPFNYYISADDVQPANYEVTIKSYDHSSAPKTLDISIEHIQTTIIGNGDFVIAGEVVNLSSEQMDIEAMAGALLNDQNNVLAANSTLTYARYLYPAHDALGRDRGPFVIKVFGPVPDATQSKVYLRSVENTTAPSTDVNVQLAGSYVDASGTYHLLGTVTNNGSSQILPSVIGGLYNSDQLIFDAASSNIPLYLNAGESAPFDLNTFEAIAFAPEGKAEPADKIVKPDLYWTFHTSYDLVSLEAEDVDVINDGSDWTVTGTVVNTSDKPLSSISAVIEFLDDDQQVTVTNSTSVFPAEGSDVIQPGELSEFTIYLYAPEGLDLGSQDYQIILQGLVSE